MPCGGEVHVWLYVLFLLVLVSPDAPSGDPILPRLLSTCSGSKYAPAHPHSRRGCWGAGIRETSPGLVAFSFPDLLSH